MVSNLNYTGFLGNHVSSDGHGHGHCFNVELFNACYQNVLCVND